MTPDNTRWIVAYLGDTPEGRWALLVDVVLRQRVWVRDDDRTLRGGQVVEGSVSGVHQTR